MHIFTHVFTRINFANSHKTGLLFV